MEGRTEDVPKNMIIVKMAVWNRRAKHVPILDNVMYYHWVIRPLIHGFDASEVQSGNFKLSW